MVESTGERPIEQVLRESIGRATSEATVVIERGPVACFANAVLSQSDVYRDPSSAEAAGFTDIPAPPTFPFVMDFWGEYPELQSPDAPTGAVIGEVMGPLFAKGGLALHGEQEFEYHRPLVVGDVLVGDGKIVEAYQKESKGRTMTFIVTETHWRDRESGEPVVTTRFNLLHRS